MPLNPVPSYPSALDSLPDPTSSTYEDADGFEIDLLLQKINAIVEALETKLGIGASTAANKQVLAGNGSGTTAFTASPTVSGSVTAETGVNVGSATGAGAGEIRTSAAVKAGGIIYPSGQVGYGLSYGTASVAQSGTTTVSTNVYGLLLVVDPSSGAYMITSSGPASISTAIINSGAQFDGTGADTGSLWSVYVTVGVITIKNRRSSGGNRTVTWLYLGGAT